MSAKTEPIPVSLERFDHSLFQKHWQLKISYQGPNNNKETCIKILSYIFICFFSFPQSDAAYVYTYYSPRKWKK